MRTNNIQIFSQIRSFIYPNLESKFNFKETVSNDGFFNFFLQWWKIIFLQPLFKIDFGFFQIDFFKI